MVQGSKEEVTNVVSLFKYGILSSHSTGSLVEEQFDGV